MANYGVKFNGVGRVAVPAWTSGSGVFSISIPFNSGSLGAVAGLIGTRLNSTAIHFVAVFTDGKYVLRMNDVAVYASAAGVLSASTEYVIEFGRTTGTSCFVNMYDENKANLIDSSTFNTADAFGFTTIGSVANPALPFDGIIWQATVTGGTEDRDYLSTVNTGTVWTDIVGGQDGTITNLETDGSEWVLFPSVIVDPTRAEIEAADETGGASPPFLVNDFDVGDLSTDTFSFTIDVQPSAGTLVTTPLSTFVFSGAPDGVYTFDYTASKNGTPYGSATVTLTIADESTLNLTATGLPDGTYEAEYYQATSPLTHIKTENVTFASEAAVVTIPLTVGTAIYTRIDTPTPLIIGTTCTGVTE